MTRMIHGEVKPRYAATTELVFDSSAFTEHEGRRMKHVPMQVPNKVPNVG